MVDGRIGRQIEGYMGSTISIVTNVKRGDGNHVRLAFEVGKKRGIFKDGDPVVCINTTRNSEDIKQFMVRIIFVTSGQPNLAVTQSTPVIDEEPAKRQRT